METVSYKVDGIDVKADLYLPGNLKPNERRPALVVCQGFSSVRQMSQPLAEFFAAAGYIVLAVDYRSFGESAGEIRGELFPDRQVEDYSAGISYLQTREDVETDRIGVWGGSFSGGVVMAVGARDRRARVVIAQTPIVDPINWMRWIRTPEQWEQLLDAIDEDRARRFRGEPSARIPAVGHFTDPGICAMPTSSDVVELVRTSPQTWRNELSLESMEKILHFSPIASVREISPRPLCILMNSGYEVLHPLDQVMDGYSAAAEPKKLVMLPYDQLGLYGGQGGNDAMNAALAFLQDEMPIGSTKGGVALRTKFEQ